MGSALELGRSGPVPKRRPQKPLIQLSRSSYVPLLPTRRMVQAKANDRSSRLVYFGSWMLKFGPFSLIQNQNSKIQNRITVAWAAPESHRRSSASFANLFGSGDPNANKPSSPAPSRSPDSRPGARERGKRRRYSRPLILYPAGRTRIPHRFSVTKSHRRIPPRGSGRA